MLRSYFDTQLMLAESKELVLRDYRQFWMGHKGDIENRCTTNKGRLPEEVIEDMREAYKRSQRFLHTTSPEMPPEEKLKADMRKQLLLIAGYSSKELEGMNLSEMSDEEFQEMVRRRMLGLMQNGGSKQTVVPIDEIDGYLAEGWEFVAALPNGKAILKQNSFNQLNFPQQMFSVNRLG